MRFNHRQLVNGVFFAVFGAALLVACERSDIELANVSREKAPENPNYNAVANEAATHGTSIITDVLPVGEEVLDGQALFAANCSACHQIGGTGVPGAFPPLNKSPYVTGPNVDRLAAIALYGLQGEIKVLGTSYNSVMAPLGGTLNDKKIAAILTYIRGAWENKAGPVDAATVAAVRKKWGTRGMFNINELGAEG